MGGGTGGRIEVGLSMNTASEVSQTDDFCRSRCCVLMSGMYSAGTTGLDEAVPKVEPVLERPADGLERLESERSKPFVSGGDMEDSPCVCAGDNMGLPSLLGVDRLIRWLAPILCPIPPNPPLLGLSLADDHIDPLGDLGSGVVK
jgi:hypothetical protein